MRDFVVSKDIGVILMFYMESGIIHVSVLLSMLMRLELRKDFESKVIATNGRTISTGILEYLYFKDLHISIGFGDYNKVT